MLHSRPRREDISGRDTDEPMEINGTRNFNVPPQRIWDALHNNDTLKSCLSGVDAIAWHGDSILAAEGGIGPIHGIVNAQVVEQTPPTHLKLAVNRTQTSGSLTVDLVPSGAGTALSYKAEVNGSGALGPAIAMAKPLVESQVGQFFSKLEGHLG